MRNNCKTVPVGGSMQNLATGWVGVKNGKYHFRPDRGSGGFALYESEAQALRFSGCPKVVEVSLELCPSDY